MKNFLTMTLIAGLASGASAQSAQDIISKVDATQKAAKDVSFRLSGNASLETSSQKIDMTIKSIPAQGVARLQFAAPDALADNVVVADRSEVRQYLFLTNQVTVTPLKEAAANNGFGGLDFTQFSNPAALLKDYSVKLLATSGAAGKRVFQLEAAPKNGGDRARLWITEAGWRPTRMQLLSGGRTVADLTVSNYRINSGLTVTGLRTLPKNAEIIRQ